MAGTVPPAPTFERTEDMKISTLIEELRKTLEREGDIEVTCTATSLEGDIETTALPDVWESTVEHLVMREGGAFGSWVVAA